MNKNIKDFLWLTLSALLPAIAVNFFFIPTKLAPGGLTGLALVLSTVTSIPVDVMAIAIPVPLLLLSMLVLGKSFGVKTLYITLMTPLFLNIIPQIDVTTNLVLGAIAGGIIIGISVGIAICRNCATGGSDLIAFLINKVIKILDVKTLIFIVDCSVIVGAGLITKNASVAIFSMFSLIVIIQVIKFVTKSTFVKN